MQTSNQTSQKEGKSIFKTGRGIVRYEGVGGLYKGLASPLLTLSVQGSILFATFGAFKEFYQAEKGWHLGNGMAGLSCGPITGVLSTVELHIRVSQAGGDSTIRLCMLSFRRGSITYDFCFSRLCRSRISPCQTCLIRHKCSWIISKSRDSKTPFIVCGRLSSITVSVLCFQGGVSPRRRTVPTTRHIFLSMKGLSKHYNKATHVTYPKQRFPSLGGPLEPQLGYCHTLWTAFEQVSMAKP